MKNLNVENQNSEASNILKETTEVECEKCKNTTFLAGALLRKISPLLTQTGRPGFLPIQTFVCAKCGHSNDELIPEELKANKIKQLGNIPKFVNVQ
jgi:DNA-directed RNA polymerase subunit M/transcription elongation factor TFIIS